MSDSEFEELIYSGVANRRRSARLTQQKRPLIIEESEGSEDSVFGGDDLSDLDEISDHEEPVDQGSLSTETVLNTVTEEPIEHLEEVNIPKQRKRQTKPVSLLSGLISRKNPKSCP
jgi:hypothetical protein